MIEISVVINASVEKVWEFWTQAEHIQAWNAASPDWHTTRVANDLKKGGRFVYRMEAKDKSVGFDFGGTYTRLKTNELIEYEMDDGRKARLSFKKDGNRTQLTEEFEPESQNPEKVQKQGWQAILNNFKAYVESH